MINQRCLPRLFQQGSGHCHFDKALQIDSDNPTIYANRAQAHTEMDNFRLAIGDYVSAIMRSPKCLDSYRKSNFFNENRRGKIDQEALSYLIKIKGFIDSSCR